MSADGYESPVASAVPGGGATAVLLGAFIITVPPLRERREDIPPLVHGFLVRAAARRHLVVRRKFLRGVELPELLAVW